MEKEQKKWWVFTFGCGQKYEGHYVEFYGTFGQARQQMIKRFGLDWGFQYTREEFDEYAKRGIPTETKLHSEAYSRYDLSEYEKLKRMLIEHDIPFEENIVYESIDGSRRPTYQRSQLIYPCDGTGRKSDAVIGFGTYGAEKGLLEQMGLIPGSVKGKKNSSIEGWLDAETIFKRWAEDFGFFVKGMEL